MLNPSPTDRIKADKVLHHRWLNKGNEQYEREVNRGIENEICKDVLSLMCYMALSDNSYNQCELGKV
eukprot:Pgem_evm1s7781